MENQVKEIRDSINKNISVIIRDEFKYANYAVSLKNSDVSFANVLVKMKELKHTLMKLDKELVGLK